MIYYQCRAHTNRMIDSAEDLLSRKHMVRTILLLRSRKAITQSDINGYVSNWKIVKERADALRESGLAEETLVREGKMVMKYRITPRGAFVGDLLEVLDLTLRGEYEFEGSDLQAELRSVCKRFSADR